MVRSLRPEDLEELIVLLRWMDADPSRGVLAPETRNPQELRWETDGGWVLEQNGVVVGYMALILTVKGARSRALWFAALELKNSYPKPMPWPLNEIGTPFMPFPTNKTKCSVRS